MERRRVEIPDWCTLCSFLVDEREKLFCIVSGIAVEITHYTEDDLMNYCDGRENLEENNLEYREDNKEID